MSDKDFLPPDFDEDPLELETADDHPSVGGKKGAFTVMFSPITSQAAAYAGTPALTGVWPWLVALVTLNLHGDCLH